MKDYTLTELMAVTAAREIQDGEVVFAGTGLPMLGAMLAQLTHAPDCCIIFEAGTVASQLAHLPKGKIHFTLRCDSLAAVDRATLHAWLVVPSSLPSTKNGAFLKKLITSPAPAGSAEVIAGAQKGSFAVGRPWLSQPWVSCVFPPMRSECTWKASTQVSLPKTLLVKPAFH
jgi:hypothetical protein